MDPGPIDPLVLTRQEYHRSTAIWNGSLNNFSIAVAALKWYYEVRSRILVSSHTFRWANVEVLLGLPVDGRPLVASTSVEPAELYRQLRDITTCEQALDGFPHIVPELVSPPEIDYGEDVDGQPLPRGPHGIRWRGVKCQKKVPTHVLESYRRSFSTILPNQIVWEPYKEILDGLPAYCKAGKNIWRTVSPLVCGHLIEWHVPNRVLRQFGMEQDIPGPFDTEARSIHQMLLMAHHVAPRVVMDMVEVHHMVVDVPEVHRVVGDMPEVPVQVQRVDQAPPLTFGIDLEDHPAAPESTPTTSIHPMDMVMSECVTPIQPSSSTFVFIPTPSLSIAHVEMTSTGPNQTCSPPSSSLPTTLEEPPLAVDLVGQVDGPCLG
uniref:Aminotransferase-like plant mobile domain-containing protein n=1 Tax=Fagus sylvatica TaxID=28930 RepID=A0A2N9GDR6_FAGSY